MQMQVFEIPSVIEQKRWGNVSISEFLLKFTGQNCRGEVLLQWEYLSNVDITYITMIAVKKYIIPFILITVESP